MKKKNKYFVGHVGCSRMPGGPKWVDNRPFWLKPLQWLNNHLNPVAVYRNKQRRKRDREFIKSLGLRFIKPDQTLFRNDIIEIKPYDIPKGLLFYTDYKFDSKKEEP